MNKVKEFLGNIAKNIWFGVKTSFLASKKYFAIKCMILFSTTAIPLINIWLWKEILNFIALRLKSFNEIIIYVTIYSLLKLATYLISCLDNYVNRRYSDELTFYIENVMIEKTSRMDLAFFDMASMGDKVRQARNNFGIMNQITWLVFNIISELINIIATFVIVSSYHLWIGTATLIFLIPYFVHNRNYTEKLLKLEKEQIREKRIMDYYNNVFYDNNVQFEIKLNNIGKYFIDQFHEKWTALFKVNMQENVKFNLRNIFIFILNTASELLVLCVSVYEVIHKKIGIGNLQYNLNMVARLREQSKLLIADINSFLVNNIRLDELREFINIKPVIEKSGTLIPSKNPRIEFCNVWFHYPNSDNYVLKDCSLIIEPNEKIGLVGINGAGKSTILKLIFRFYDPQKGTIKLDGTDIKEYDVYAVRKIFSVLFQEYVTYCLPLREIIALSDFDKRYDDEKLKHACDMSGVTEIIKDWENGYDTVIGRYYEDNGKDFSGGQWQLVSLARAYFKDSDYIILDEPSAALDPISEDKIFKQLYGLSKQKSALTISHRLSNTYLADKIIVIEDGYIIEQGSHSDLLQKNGRYAQLFKLQASRYT